MFAQFCHVHVVTINYERVCGHSKFYGRKKQPVQHLWLVRMLIFVKKQTKIYTYKYANKNALIRLRRYTGWPAPLLYANTKVRVSLVENLPS